MFLIFMSVHKNFVETLKIVVKNSEKINCSYGKDSYDLKENFIFLSIPFLFFFSISNFFGTLVEFQLDRSDR